MTKITWREIQLLHSQQDTLNRLLKMHEPFTCLVLLLKVSHYIHLYKLSRSFNETINHLQVLGNIQKTAGKRRNTTNVEYM